MTSFRMLAACCAILLAVVAGAPLVAAQDVGTPAAEGGATTFALPGEAVYPEGVAYDPATGDFFVGSSVDGTIYRGNVAGGEVEVFSPAGADGRIAATGLEVDGAGRLYVAGSTTGLVSIYSTSDGRLLQQFDNGLAPNTFLNDVAVTAGGAAYVTDSFNAFLYRIPAAPAADVATPAALGEFEIAVDFTDSVFQYGDGFNANGIVATEDGAFLLIVQTSTGGLFRVDVATGEVIQVDVGGADLTNGDGMQLDGRTLYVVRNQNAQIVPVELAADFASGTAGEPFTDASFAFPTTNALYDGCMLVVNSQFDTQESGQPVLPFTVSAIPVPETAADGGTPIAITIGTPVAAGC